MAFNLSNIFRRDKLKAVFSRIGTPKTYKALVSQVGTDAPTVIELVNSLDATITPSRSEANVYLLTSDLPIFLANKTLVLKGISTDTDYATFYFLNVNRISDTQIVIQTSGEGLLDNAAISIEVFD